ncbi:MAG: MFS transporter [Hamadaea sp.]|uniref:MFS transporter n=1 Tax=Hamadaea sp. TaxID=2024425 RepID=UPI00183CC656|nr:MFS transporter [Hamadaea sp.]NUR74100.1 MFS transporter [Hamadaea sp.]NUT19993.1 MFS transporter [Hamadaea sp.]
MRRTPALAFLLLTIFIDALGLGIVVPVVPALLTSVSGGTAPAAYWSGLINTGYPVLQFLFVPLLGRLSDRWGRRPILIGSLTLLGVDYLAHALASAPWLFALAHALAGAFAGTWTVVNAYVADVIPSEDRLRAFGLIGAAFSLGFVAGPAVGGLLGDLDLRLPFLAAAALAFANAGYGLLILPESRRGDGTTSLNWSVANPFSSILMVVRRPTLRRVTLARFLGDLARMTNQVIWVFVMIARFAWPTSRVGLLMAASAIVGTAASAWLSGPLVRRLGHRGAAVLTSLASALSFVGFAVAPADLLWLAIAAGCVGSIAGTALQAWVTDLVGPDEQGTVQGALASLGSLAEMCVPIVASALFAWSLTVGAPGLILVVAAGCVLVATVVIHHAPSS